jgi:N-acetylated-alpha-linked acidic dipeptidase
MNNRPLGFMWLALLVSAAPAGDLPPIQGFSAEASVSQRAWEAKFKAVPNTDNLREFMRRLSARPHHVGSAYDKENAEWIRDKFREWGLNAEIETFDVLFPTPKERALELVKPERYTARLEEPPVAVDPTSNQRKEQLPTYNAYSPDGDVTAPLVYVNYGIPEDYEALEQLGVGVKGAIVIARYGNSWRGIKPKVAAEHGAVGCIIYSDPRDDGYAQGDVFPVGSWRPPEGAQRGSVIDMPLYVGDPLTPGVGATPDARRLPLSEARTIARIPVLPVSYGDAQPLLAALKGPVAPAGWRGALPITYHIGPGPAEVHLKVKSNWDIKPVYDVIARIPGSTEPGTWIIRGNHHDAWVNGADDPVSAAVAEMEEAHGLAELLKQGWRPKRTIIYCLWDGEEEGMLGSTEWAETHAEELRQHAAVYINSDSNARGVLNASGSHSLEKFVNGVAKDIQDPETDYPVWKRMRLSRIAKASAADREELRARGDLRIDALGAGSDYTVFLDHLGISTLDLGYGGEDGGGIYHSIYDDFYYYTHFSDSDFRYGRTLAQTIGTTVMRLADADLLPYDFAGLADTVRKYVDDLESLSKSKRDEITERNKEIEEGVFIAIADPKHTLVPPKAEDVPPFLNFAPLRNGLAALERSAGRYRKALEAMAPGRKPLDAANRKLSQVERALTLPDGLPGRPWFTHQIYAPGVYTGYSVKTIPGVREAIEQKRWPDANEQITRAGKALLNEAAAIDEVSAELEK